MSKKLRIGALAYTTSSLIHLLIDGRCGKHITNFEISRFYVVPLLCLYTFIHLGIFITAIFKNFLLWFARYSPMSYAKYTNVDFCVLIHNITLEPPLVKNTSSLRCRSIYDVCLCDNHIGAMIQASDH